MPMIYERHAVVVPRMQSACGRRRGGGPRPDRNSEALSGAWRAPRPRLLQRTVVSVEQKVHQTGPDSRVFHATQSQAGCPYDCGSAPSTSSTRA